MQGSVRALLHDMLYEVELGSIFGNKLLQLATLKFVARQVDCGGDNTGNKDSQLATQQSCATSCKKMSPVLLGFKTRYNCSMCKR